MLSVDPGTKERGWANWKDGKLIGCGIARGKDWISTVKAMPDIKVDELVIEDQQIYRHSRIDAHSLLAVARVVGAFVILYDSPKVRLVKPQEWKGQVPKAICNKRTISKLNETEIDVLTTKQYRRTILHNLFDAVGIGLWTLRR